MEPLAHYVNDRPYCNYRSFPERRHRSGLGSAMKGSRRIGKSWPTPPCATRRAPVRRSGWWQYLLHGLFEPLGYQAEARRIAPMAFREWGID